MPKLVWSWDSSECVVDIPQDMHHYYSSDVLSPMSSVYQVEEFVLSR